MRRILITDKIKGIAQDYAQKMENKDTFNQGKDPKTRLLQLSKQLGRAGTTIKIPCGSDVRRYINHKGRDFPAPSKYVKAIYDNYDGLNSLLPSEYGEKIMKQVDAELAAYDVSGIKVKLPKKGVRPLFELIVEAMRYDKVQKDIMPEFIRKLEIKTCVYCNAQFATTATVQELRLVKKKLAKVVNKDVSCYELDHNWPKSKYPYLCTNFYNLQPSCGSCNRRKNDRQLDFSLYYEEGETNVKPVHIALAHEDIIRFRTTNNAQGITPYLCNEGEDYPPAMSDVVSIVGKMNKMLGLQGIYDEHEDIVEEILWKHKIYSEGYMTALETQIKNLGIAGFDMKRFVLGGYYERKEDFLKRPLSILKNDVWEQLCAVKKE